MVANVSDLSGLRVSTRDRRLRRRIREIAAATAVLMSILAFASNRASAHAIVVSARPTMNSTVAVGDLDVTIAFNTLIDAKRSRLTLAAPDAAVTPIKF